MRAQSRFRVLTGALLNDLRGRRLTAPAVAKHRHSYPDRMDLPVGFQPEGVTIGKAPYAYLASLADGAIFAVNLRTGAGRLVSEGPGTPSLGLKVDRRGLLYVAGGPSGTARVVDSRSGANISHPLTPNSSLINDVLLTRRAAWFTDSRQSQLYRLSRGRGTPTVTTLPLSGEWVQQAGTNANGIATTPDRRALLVVQTATATLFRVNRRSGAATKVDLDGYALTHGDGLLVSGRTLYVVQNRLNQVAVIKLDRRGRAGRLVEVLASPEFDVPTTVAAYRGSLYMPNARFGTDSPGTADYWITRIDT